MKKTYPISGMSCQGCRSHVEALLKETEGVKNASVNLDQAEATLEADESLSLEKLQTVFAKDGGNYQIAE